MFREEGADTLVIHLPGFKKEHLRIQIDGNDNMKISGERLVEENQWSRFLKEISVPKHCNTSETTAKFVRGLLYIKFPKKAGGATEQYLQPTKTPGVTAYQTMVGEKRLEQAKNNSYKSALGRVRMRLKEKRLVIGVGLGVSLVIYAVNRIRSYDADGYGYY